MQQSEKILLVLSLAPTLSAHCSKIKIITVILIMSKVLSSTFFTKRGQTCLAAAKCGCDCLTGNVIFVVNSQTLK